MFKAPYYKADGKKGKAQSLPDSIFDGTVNESAMHQVVKVYLSNQRQGTHAAKTRSEVRGGSRKPWRQKGTGRARQGTIRAVQWEGGGVAFPPIPHSWRKRLPKKVRSLARRSALNDRAENDRVLVADMPSMDAPRTREMVSFLAALELNGKTLILTDGKNENVYLSSRNLEQVQVLPFGNESVYDVLWANTVVIEKSALDGVGAAPAKAGKTAAVEKAVAEEKEEAPVAEAVVAETADEAPADEAPEEVEAAAEEVTEEPEAAEAADSEDETEEKSDA
jgi:large subunit ribosomal protein L4